MNSFFGQGGSFGGGFLTGPQGGQTREMAFGGGGGPIGPMGQAPMIQEVPVTAGAVVYAGTATAPAKPRQPGRQAPRYYPHMETPFSMPVGPEGFVPVQRQKRY